jgi:hypothetical protein
MSPRPTKSAGNRSRWPKLPANVDVFAGGDAAEENHFALGRQFRCQMPRVALDWHSVTRIVLIDVDLRKFTQIIEMNSRSRIDQPACRRDHKHT